MMFYQRRKNLVIFLQLKKWDWLPWMLSWGSTNEIDNCLLQTYQVTKTVYLKKSAKLKIQDKVVELTAEKNIIGKMAIMSQQRNTEMNEIFCYPLVVDSMGILK